MEMIKYVDQQLTTAIKLGNTNNEMIYLNMFIGCQFWYDVNGYSLDSCQTINPEQEHDSPN